MDQGVRIRNIPSGSPFSKSGLRKGDRILRINGEEISDELDFRFFAADNFLHIDVLREGRIHSVVIQRQEGDFLGLDFYENSINRCRNHCVFCFIDQMPPGLRKKLYIKDEDFKYSFLNGNYVTLSAAVSTDLQKLARLGISPLYISIHATDTGVRNRMLGNRKAPPVMEQLKFLKKSGISFHTQIVVCRGYNDGQILLKTIKDLFRFGSALLSIAVVPVGLTRFRKRIKLEAFETESSASVCREVTLLGDKFSERDGVRKLFLADEFFIKAGLKVPGRKYYEDYPQIENGVGLISMLLEEWKVKKRHLKNSSLKNAAYRKRLLITSVSAFPFLRQIKKEAQKLIPGLDLEVMPVVNSFFGETVTVAGLLTAADVIRTVKGFSKRHDFGLVLPGAMFNYAGNTLDGFSVHRIRRVLSMDIVVAGSIGEVF